jgi:acetyl-CoA carboxylase, biotin carboxylase subunit
VLSRVLVANRGEIAARVIRACSDEGAESVLAASEADRDSLPARMADHVVIIGPARPAASYLSLPSVIGAALLTECDALHPGYGFLSERPELAEACSAHGICFVGPPADVIRRGGDKIAARQLASSLGIPLGAGSGWLPDVTAAARAARRAGYPVLIKAAAAGGGRGMVLVRSEGELPRAFDLASGEALAAFGDGRLYLERHVERARHVEVQVLADTRGRVIHLSDRDCSCQRRHQKLVEEAPAAAVPAELRGQMQDAAVTLMRALGYVGAGTVEFLVDEDRGGFSFLEVNTRVQVEHPVTEMITGVDIVREQLRIAAGERLSVQQRDVRCAGHAIEVRVNAEAPDRGFAPTPGRIEVWEPPRGAGIRVDTHCYPGYRVPPHYDSLLAKLICHGTDRAEALSLAAAALEDFRIEGIDTTLPLHRSLIRHADVRGNRVSTRWLEETFLPEWSRKRTVACAAGGSPAP